MDHFDVVVIGAGPGGYVAAIRAAQLGMSVCCVDAWQDEQGKPRLGGTCLNVGCIPSKALLESSEKYHEISQSLGEHGIVVEGVSLDLAKMQARKKTIVNQLTDGVAHLFRKNGISSLHGRASFVSIKNEMTTLKVTHEKNELLVQGDHVIIATGSMPRPLPVAAVDNHLILDSAGALSLHEVPGRLAIAGAGVIGLEMGSVWKRLGSEVTLIEAMPDFLPTADHQLSKEVFNVLTRDEGLQIQLDTRLEKVSRSGNQLQLLCEGKSAGVLEVDRLLVATGRMPCTEGLCLENVGLKSDMRGMIPVDDHCQTAVKSIWAIGDVVRGPMLAHKAEEEGVAVAEQIAGQKGHVSFENIPWVIYTSPEIAWAGKTEQILKDNGQAYRSGIFPLRANARAKSMGDTRGFIKILADQHTDQVLGVHIFGAQASELISEAVLAMEFGASSEDIARTVHAHPTLSEALREAALSVEKRSINY